MVLAHEGMAAVVQALFAASFEFSHSTTISFLSFSGAMVTLATLQILHFFLRRHSLRAFDDQVTGAPDSRK